MRRRVPWFALAFLLASCLLSREAAAQDTCDPIFDEGDHILEGHIGTNEVRARMGRGGPNDPDDEHAVSGEFEYTTRWTMRFEFNVKGVVAPDCSFQLTELDSMRRKTGTWVLRFTAGRLEGSRTDAVSGIISGIVLEWAPEVDCSGRGAWRTFRSSSWPITFSYPANWQLSEDADGLELLCPSPDRLIYSDGRAITIERGVGFRTAVTRDGRTGTAAGFFFVRFPPRPWMIGDYDWCATEGPGGPGCYGTRTGRRFGMTVVQGSGGEDRLYTRYGYVGQGWGNITYLFVHGTRWVTLQSHDLPEWSAETERPGPARFDGTGVTERIVRSIRPR